MSCYSTGTVTVVVGSTVVVGTDGTTWNTNVDAGDLFKLTDESSFYDIGSVSSATRLILTAGYTNANYPADTERAGMTYQIVTDYTPNKNYPEMGLNDTNFPHIFTKAIRMIDSDMPSSSYFQCGAHQYIFFGSEVAEAAIVAAANAVDASVKGSIYMSSGSGTLWVFDSDTSAAQLS